MWQVDRNVLFNSFYYFIFYFLFYYIILFIILLVLLYFITIFNLFYLTVVKHHVKSNGIKYTHKYLYTFKHIVKVKKKKHFYIYHM